VGIFVFGAASLLPNSGFLDPSSTGDTVIYKGYGDLVRQGQVPYRDFFFEYPPGSLPMVVVPSLVAPDRYSDASKALQWLLGALTIVFVAISLAALRVGSRALLAGTVFVGLLPALLGNLTFTRFDFWPAALLAAALAALLTARNLLGGAALALATAAKIYPVVALPIVLLFVWRRDGRREALRVAACSLLVLGAILLPFAIASPDGFGLTFQLQFTRPLQLESLGAVALLAAHGLGIYGPWVATGSGSHNLEGESAHLLSLFSSALLLIALVVIWYAFARSERTPAQLVASCAAAITAFVIFGKVLSPQYLIWLVPLIALLHSRRSSLLLLVALLLTQGYFQHDYHDIVILDPLIWVLIARDVCLLVLFCLLARDCLRSATGVERSSGITLFRTAPRPAADS
jgi:hypothetical protein